MKLGIQFFTAMRAKEFKRPSDEMEILTMTHEFYLVINHVIPGCNTPVNKITDSKNYCYGLYKNLCYEMRNSEQFIVARACPVEKGKKPSLP